MGSRLGSRLLPLHFWYLFLPGRFPVFCALGVFYSHSTYHHQHRTNYSGERRRSRRKSMDIRPDTCFNCGVHINARLRQMALEEDLSQRIFRFRYVQYDCLRANTQHYTQVAKAMSNLLKRRTKQTWSWPSLYFPPHLQCKGVDNTSPMMAHRAFPLPLKLNKFVYVDPARFAQIHELQTP